MGWLAAGIVGLFLLSWPPVEWLLSRPLESPYFHRPPQTGAAQAIVVLSASVRLPGYEEPYYLPDIDTYQRCAMASWLYTHGHPLPILACGGPESDDDARTYADTMKEVLEKSGVPASAIWTERQSHTTHQNATFGAAILRERGIHSIVLVTQARDMTRAARCFEKEGLEVIPDPVAVSRHYPIRDLLIPSWKAIAGNERTLHESAGLAWYWMRGWI